MEFDAWTNETSFFEPVIKTALFGGPHQQRAYRLADSNTNAKTRIGDPLRQNTPKAGNVKVK